MYAESDPINYILFFFLVKTAHSVRHAYIQPTEKIGKCADDADVPVVG